ncbi:MAG: PAS domain-containing protein, partial [Comamonas sp.]
MSQCEEIAHPVAQQLAQLSALDRVMAIAEFEPDGSLSRANDNFLALLGYTREQVMGRHHSSFCTAAFAASAEYRNFWPQLRDGKARTGLAERLRHDGSSCWLEATYTPVLDAQGKVRQILKIAT